MRDKIVDKKIENEELHKEINKWKVMNSLYNNALKKIKDLNIRLEDNDEIKVSLEVCEEQLHLEKEIVEEERMQLHDEVKILEVRVNKEKE